MDYFKDKVIPNIEKFGWHVQGVGDNPVFTYSVGLSMLGFPEVIISGLPIGSAHLFINMIGSEMKAGKIFQIGKKYFGYAAKEDIPMVFIEVEPKHYLERMCVCNKMYGEVKAIQMVWCDADGVFQWEEGFDENYRNEQDLFGSVDKAGHI